MAWIHLLIAGALEIGWALGLKYTDGLTRYIGISTATVIGMILSYVFLALAMRDLPVGTAYPVWTGIGAVGTALFGIVVLHESRDPLRLFCLALIVVGVIGLKALGGDPPAKQTDDVAPQASASN
jgi:quaternary ammonium compound-resistance protein SugE